MIITMTPATVFAQNIASGSDGYVDDFTDYAYEQIENEIYISDTDGDGVFDGAEITKSSDPFLFNETFTDVNGDGIYDKYNIYNKQPT